MKREQVDFLMSSDIKLDFSQLLTFKLPESWKAQWSLLAVLIKWGILLGRGDSPSQLPEEMSRGEEPARKPGTGQQPIKTDDGKSSPLQF